MARTLDSIVTVSGQEWAKRVDSTGRTYHVKQGEGRVSQQQFAAAKSHSGPAEAFSRGTFEPESLDQLGHPFDADMTVPVGALERGSNERNRAGEVNRWLGFRYDENTPDDPLEAAREYHEMKKELAEADTVEREQEVKRSYGIGGSG